MGRKSKKLIQKIKKLKNLKQYKDLSDKELEEIAVSQIREEKKQDNSGFTVDEKRERDKKLEEYVSQYHLTSLGELDQLKKLVNLEIIYKRLENKLTAATMSNLSETNEISSLTKMIVEIGNTIQTLRKSLGLMEERKVNDAFEYVKKLKDKFKRWKEENQATRSLTCPYCSKMILLNLRTDAWETKKHPFFKDKIYYNEHLLRLYLAKKITKQDVAKVLGTSDFYADWLLKKWTTRPEYEKLKKEAEEL